MIQLPAPIAFPVRPIIIPSDLVFQLQDDPNAQTVRAIFPFTPHSLLLWEKETYTAIGNWTQEQAEARILELLGNNPKQVFSDLIHGKP